MKNATGNLCTTLPALVALSTLFAVGARGADPAPNLSAGQKAPAFQAKTTDGKAVNFPQDYKGKIVMIDFWATWCPPCRAEIPHVLAAYKKYHARGLEILGVSLDHPDSAMKLASFAQQNEMTWPQIYDGKYWKAELAVQFGIHSIPRPILVDGNTGVIVAEGMAARGDDLAPAIEKALAGLKK